VRQVIQNIQDGSHEVATIPDPVARPGQVLIANAASLISAGTEKSVIELASKSLLGKARQRPDQVRRVLEKVRTEGLLPTLDAVRRKLDEPMALGYSSAGVVLAVGEGVQRFRPGDRVASNGSHAGIVSVPQNLCAHVPDGVSADHASFAVVASIAMQGVRLSRLQLGESAFVIGLGLIGQITVALLRAAGVDVYGTDLDAAKCRLAERMGCLRAEVGMSAGQVESLTRGLGADAVLITASTASSGPVELAADAVRQKGRIVAVGAVGMELPRPPLYLKEAEFVVSCSYGPGRYDADYEERGQDYPPAHVRWTEGRNIQAVLDLMAAGKLDVEPLLTHRFPVEEAEAAYALIMGDAEPYLGVVLQYPEVDPGALERSRPLRSPGSGGPVRVGALGAGNYARMVLLPELARCDDLQPAVLCAPGGLSASHAGDRLGFTSIATDEAALFDDPGLDALLVLTRHDQHGRQVEQAVRAGKHVFVEKPLALTLDEVDAIDAALDEAADPAPVVAVGFNRRFAPLSSWIRAAFADVSVPIAATVRFNAGALPEDHWTQDEGVGGGRVVGEACHGIDLATYLVGSPPVRVFAEAIGGPDAPGVTHDQCLITLRHANGSISSVVYLAGGDKAFPKERVEVIGGGRVGVIDDFKTASLTRGGKTERKRLMGQDKGHRAEIETFARSLRHGGDAPIPWTDIRAVSRAAILAVRSIREGIPFEVPR